MIKVFEIDKKEMLVSYGIEKGDKWERIIKKISI